MRGFLAFGRLMGSQGGNQPSGALYPFVDQASLIFDFQNNAYYIRDKNLSEPWQIQSLPGLATFTNSSANRTYFGSNGLLQYAGVNEARFAYDPITLTRIGYLAESSVQNLLTFASDYANAAWSKVGVTIGSAVTGPDGTANMLTLNEDSSIASAHQIGYTQSKAAAANVYVASGFTKQVAGTRNLSLQIGGPLGGFTIIVNPSDGSIVAPNQAIGVTTGLGFNKSAVQNCGNGIFRVSINISASAAITTLNLTPGLANGTSIVYSGDGSSKVAFWGAQIEVPQSASPAQTATSFIPATSSLVTRATDVLIHTWDGEFNAITGSLYAKSTQVNGINRLIYDSTDGTISNRIQDIQNSTTNSMINTLVGGVSQAALNCPLADSSATNKTAGAYAVNDFAAAANGGTIQTDSSGTIPTMTQLNLAGNVSTAGSLSGILQTFIYYPARLSNANLVMAST